MRSILNTGPCIIESFFKNLQIQSVNSCRQRYKTNKTFLYYNGLKQNWLWSGHFNSPPDRNISVSPACKAPADTGSAASYLPLGRSASGLGPPIGLIELLDQRATAPGGDCDAGGRAEVASEVRSTGTAGRGPACWCRLVHLCRQSSSRALMNNSNRCHTFNW